MASCREWDRLCWRSFSCVGDVLIGGEIVTGDRSQNGWGVPRQIRGNFTNAHTVHPPSLASRRCLFCRLLVQGSGQVGGGVVRAVGNMFGPRSHTTRCTSCLPCQCERGGWVWLLAGGVAVVRAGGVGALPDDVQPLLSLYLTL